MAKTTPDQLDDRYVEVLGPANIRVKGTRVALDQLLLMYQEGAAPEQIAMEFPTVTLEQVHGVIACYLRHQALLDGYIRRSQKQADVLRARLARRPLTTAMRRLRKHLRHKVAG